jgi:anti-sigma B factor antagonist
VEIDVRRVGLTGLLVKASGRLDLDNAVEYGGKIKETIEDNDDIDELILDFAEISFISSFGLKVILELHKDMALKGSMKLRNVPEAIVKSFKMVGFDKFLVIE